MDVGKFVSVAVLDPIESERQYSAIEIVKPADDFTKRLIKRYSDSVVRLVLHTNEILTLLSVPNLKSFTFWPEFYYFRNPVPRTSQIQSFLDVLVPSFENVKELSLNGYSRFIRKSMMRSQFDFVGYLRNITTLDTLKIIGSLTGSGKIILQQKNLQVLILIDFKEKPNDTFDGVECSDFAGQVNFQLREFYVSNSTTNEKLLAFLQTQKNLKKFVYYHEIAEDGPEAVKARLFEYVFQMETIENIYLEGKKPVDLRLENLHPNPSVRKLNLGVDFGREFTQKLHILFPNLEQLHVRVPINIDIRQFNHLKIISTRLSAF